MRSRSVCKTKLHLRLNAPRLSTAALLKRRTVCDTPILTLTLVVANLAACAVELLTTTYGKGSIQRLFFGRTL
jgi:uncharacterized sodium:solute symporter family permease YidK